jgi:hypothetical protein
MNHPLPAENDKIRLDPASGTLTVRFDLHRVMSHTPRVDGRPALKGGRIVQARAGGGVIAAMIFTQRETILQWFSDREGLREGLAVIPRLVSSFVLSRDCRRVALGFANRRLDIRDLGGSNIPRFVAPLGRYHSSIAVAIGSSFLTIAVGKHAHLVRWDGARLESMYCQGTGDPSAQLVAILKGQTPRHSTRAIATENLDSTDSYDGSRFIRGCLAFGLRIFVDIFGQIVVRDSDGALVCMFFVFRENFAAWLPDGTQIGPLPILGRPSTPDGRTRIAAALRAAQARTPGDGQSA